MKIIKTILSGLDNFMSFEYKKTHPVDTYYRVRIMKCDNHSELSNENEKNVKNPLLFPERMQLEFHNNGKSDNIENSKTDRFC